MGRGEERKSLLLVVFVLSLLYAFYDEIIQTKIPGRGFQVSDLIFDVLGVLAGLAFYCQMRKWFIGKKQ